MAIGSEAGVTPQVLGSWGQESWLGDNKHLLLFQRTRVWIPAPYQVAQLLIAQLWEIQCSLLASVGTHMLMHIHISRHTYTCKLKKILG